MIQASPGLGRLARLYRGGAGVTFPADKRIRPAGHPADVPSRRRALPSEAERRGSRAPTLACLIFLLCGAPAFAQPEGQALEGKIVKRIDFVGLELFSKTAVLARLETQEGRPFSRKALESDMKKLAGHASVAVQGPPNQEEPKPLPPKVFSLIPSWRAVLDPSDDTVIITVNGLENRRVADLVFLGAVEFRRDDLLPLIRTRAGSPVDDFTLELDRQEILRHYREKGYHYCEVDFVKKTEATGDLIVFKIVEGPEVTIRNVEFRGAKSFPDGELLAEMPFTDTPGILSSQEYVLEQVKRDINQLERFYRGRGFLDAQVTLIDQVPTSDHEEVDLVILVDEGEVYIVKSITIDGLTLVDPAELQAEFRTNIGEAYEPAYDLAVDMSKIVDRLQEFGHSEAIVRDLSTFGRETNDVDVRLEVTEGPLIRVGEVIIVGNIETQDRVLRREIELYTGEPLNQRRLRRARSRIRSLGYWLPQRGVQVDTPEIPFQSFQIYRDAYVSLRDTNRLDVKDILVSVQEEDTGSLRFAAGIGSNSGVIGDITYTKTNFDPFDFPKGAGDILDAFTGGGQILVLSVQPGTVFSRWRAAWTNPRVFDSPYSVGAEFFQTIWRRRSWDEERFGYGFNTGRRIGEDLYASLQLRDELVDVSDIDNDAPQLVFDFEGENEVTSLTLNLRLNRLNDFLSPTGGYLLEASLEHAGLWGDIEFNKALVRGEYYFEVYENEKEELHVVRLKGTLGWASEFGDTRDIPVYERFYAGGAGTMRGFRFRHVGPFDNGDPIGGKAMWLASSEYQFPLFHEYFRGVTFIDTGTVAENWSSGGISDVRVSVGVGLRIVIPFLSTDRPLAIDFGFPLVKYGDDETQIISFSFGSR